MRQLRVLDDDLRWTSVVGVLAPLAVLVAGLGATWRVVDYEVRVGDRELQSTADLVGNAIADELAGLLEVQIGGAAATAAALSIDPDLSRDTFRRYAASLEGQLPTLLGVGYVRRAPQSELPELEETARADGAPDFRVRDLGPGPDHAILLYNEPAGLLRASWGVDLTSVEGAARALQRATDSGRAIVTERIVLAVDRPLPPLEQPASYVAYGPVFVADAPVGTVAERRAAVLGWSNLPFRAQELLDVIDIPAEVTVVLLDGEQVIATGGSTGHSERATSRQPVSSANAELRWVLDVSVPRSVIGAGIDRPGTARTVSVSLTVLLAALVALVAAGSRRWAFAARDATRQLQRRARELERSNEDLDALATVVAHDLSEPLTVIGGYAELLVERYPAGSSLDDAAVSHLRTVSGAAQRMRAMLDALLRLARIREDRHRPQRVSFAGIVDQALANLQAPLESSEANVVVGPLPLVWGDPDLLIDLVQNLVSNAVRYRDPERPLRIGIDAEHDGTWWRITVADNGRGVPANQRERIFQTFRRLHDRGPGLGIGLTVARRIVGVHGGEIHVGETPGGGAAFTFSLPDQQPEQDRHTNQPSARETR